MIRRHGASLRFLLMVADAIMAVGLVVVVYRFRYLFTDGLSPIRDPETAFAPMALYAGAWVALLFAVGQYRLRARWTLRSEAAGIARATVWLALLSLSFLFLYDLTDLSRMFLVFLFPVQGVVTLGTRAALRRVFMHMRRHGRNNRYVLVIGTGPEAIAFAQRIEEHSAFGLRIAGFLGDPPAASLNGWPYLGPASDILKVMHDGIVDEVAVCLPRAEWAEVEDLIEVCQEEGKIVRIPLEVPQVQSRLQFIEDLDGVAVLSIVRAPDRTIALALKRVMDVSFATLALIVAAPVITVIAAYIALRDGRPVLFRQTRLGVHGRPFTIVKFRTMVRDAEERFPGLVASSHTNGAAFKMAYDPRTTSWGRFLRATGLDELPQLWNVLKGEMSLVGPRPAPAREVDTYDVWHRRRLSMKPGLTGLWQITSRLDRDFDHRARLDLDYIDRWSLWLDLRIVAQTVPVLFHANGR
jgi:exopolysaccharide biosynthesis polyprenyl glycosylphosphotransferase